MIPAHLRKLALQRISREYQQINAAPMDPDQCRDLSLFALQALAAIPEGTASENDLANLEVISNITLLLCEIGYGPDEIDTAKAGQTAVMAVRARFNRMGKVGAQGGELAALRACVVLHDAQMHAGVTRAEMTQVLREMKSRMKAGHVHKIEESV